MLKAAAPCGGCACHALAASPVAGIGSRCTDKPVRRTAAGVFSGKARRPSHQVRDNTIKACCGYGYQPGDRNVKSALAAPFPTMLAGPKHRDSKMSSKSTFLPGPNNAASLACRIMDFEAFATLITASSMIAKFMFNSTNRSTFAESKIHRLDEEHVIIRRPPS